MANRWFGKLSPDQLVERAKSSVRRLWFYDVDLRGCRDVIELLKANRHLTKLELFSCYIDSDDLAHLLESSSIRELAADADRCHGFYEHISQAEHLTSLALRCSTMSATEAALLAKNKYLTKLDVNGGEASAVDVLRALFSSPTITEFSSTRFEFLESLAHGDASEIQLLKDNRLCSRLPSSNSQFNVVRTTTCGVWSSRRPTSDICCLSAAWTRTKK